MTGARDSSPWRVLAVAVLVGAMALLDTTIVYVAVPSMRAGLDASVGAVQWVVSGYALAYGLTLVAGGRLGDAHGRRRLLLVGLAVFVSASALVGLAPTAGVAIAARVLQGVGAGLLVPQVWGLVQELFSGEERGRAIGVVAAALSVAAATGPVAGGAIIAALGDDLGWRAVFLVNLPLGAVAAVAVLRVVPRARAATDPPRRLDVAGSVLLGAAVLCLLLPLMGLEGGHRGLLALLPAAPLLLWAFVRWERRLAAGDGAPLLDVPVLRRLPGYGTGVAIAFCYYVGFTEVLLVLSTFLQEGADLGPARAGLLIAPFAAGSVLSAPFSGRLVARHGGRVRAAALGVVAAVLLTLALLAPSLSNASVWWVLPPALLVAGAAGGVLNPSNFTLTLAPVPTAMGGAASGALETAQRVGSSVGAVVLMTAYALALDRADAGAALRAALLTSLVLVLATLGLAVAAARRSGSGGA